MGADIETETQPETKQNKKGMIVLSKTKKRLAVLIAAMVLVVSALTVFARTTSKDGYMNASGYNIHCSILVLGANLSSVAQASTNSGGMNNPTPVTLPSGSSVSTTVALYDANTWVAGASGGTTAGTYPGVATPNGYAAASIHKAWVGSGANQVYKDKYLDLP